MNRHNNSMLETRKTDGVSVARGLDRHSIERPREGKVPLDGWFLSRVGDQGPSAFRTTRGLGGHFYHGRCVRVGVNFE